MHDGRFTRSHCCSVWTVRFQENIADCVWGADHWTLHAVHFLPWGAGFCTQCVLYSSCWMGGAREPLCSGLFLIEGRRACTVTLTLMFFPVFVSHGLSKAGQAEPRLRKNTIKSTSAPSVTRLPPTPSLALLAPALSWKNMCCPVFKNLFCPRVQGKLLKFQRSKCQS